MGGCSRMAVAGLQGAFEAVPLARLGVAPVEGGARLRGPGPIQQRSRARLVCLLAGGDRLGACAMVGCPPHPEAGLGECGGQTFLEKPVEQAGHYDAGSCPLHPRE